MTYDEAYRKFFSYLVKYTFPQIDNNLYYSEEITSEVLTILYEKWDELKSHDEKVISTWLYRAVNYKIKEFYRKKPFEPISSDDESGQNLIERKLYETDSEIDQYEEVKKYERYIEKIQMRLKAKELELFNYVVLQKYSYGQIAALLHLSEPAVKMRWYRLQVKIHPYVINLIKNKT